MSAKPKNRRPPIKIKDKTWDYLGEGSFNLAYSRTDEKGMKWVYKQNKSKHDNTDWPDRAVRLWNIINPSLKATEYKKGNYHGWIAPFVEGQEPTQQEICNKLLEIYNDTGRIVVDACTPGNFVKSTNGKVVCIDIGGALQLESRIDYAMHHSRASLDFWADMERAYQPYFQKNSLNENKADIVKTTQALLYLKENKPDADATALQNNLKLIALLSDAYANKIPSKMIPNFDETFPDLSQPRLLERFAGSPKKGPEQQSSLTTTSPTALQGTQSVIKNEILDYIKSRGSETRQKTFELNFFRRAPWHDQELTKEKVANAKILIKNLDACSNVFDVIEQMNNSLKWNHNKQTEKGKKDDGNYGSCLSDCLKKITLPPIDEIKAFLINKINATTDTPENKNKLIQEIDKPTSDLKSILVELKKLGELSPHHTTSEIVAILRDMELHAQIKDLSRMAHKF